jgi:hypothetical protein
MIATAGDRAFEPELKRSVAAFEALTGAANERERGHAAAARAWLEGDLERAAEGWGRVALDNPRDLLAIQLAHLCDFYLGYSAMLRDRMARVLPRWREDMSGYGFLLGMHAFGLEEAGDYARAEETGRRAVALNRQDGWGVHAVAHVMEMQGRADDGAAWLRGTADGWAPGSMFAFHCWWHLAVFEVDRGRVDEALRLFDGSISAGGFGQALELVDGSALLWRLMTLGHDVGDRWTKVAANWRTRASDRFYAFNDLHAMMAFVGTGDEAAQREVLAASAAAAEGRGTNAMMSREVGLPACRGFAAFGRGDWAECIAQLMPLRGKANRFGGSHAQRDVFSWTLVEAALRAGDRALAAGLVAERLALKPRSPVNLAWNRRIGSVLSAAA